MKHCYKAIAALVFGSVIVSASQVTITDNVNTVFGAVLGGNITNVRISTPAFVATDGTHVSAFSTNIAITGGAFTYSLTPSIGSNPFAAYTFTMSGPTALRSFSVGVPVTTDPTPLTFNQLQITSPWLSWGLGLGPTLSGSSGGGGGSGGTNGNATSILSLGLSSTLPTDGQGWLLNSTSGLLEPVAIPYWKRYSIPFTRLTSINSNTGTVTLLSRGTRQKVCGVSVYVTSAFIAASLSSINLTVGDSNGTSNLYTPVSASVADNGNKDYNIMGSATGYGNITATVTATGALLSALTAGNADVDVCIITQP